MLAGTVLGITLGAPTSVPAQFRQGEIIGTLFGGVNKYHGEFSDDMFAIATGVGFWYVPVDRLLVEARFGIGEYRWKITDAKIQRFPGYFGPAAVIGDRYPGTLTKIEPENESRVTTVDILASWVIAPGIPASPFITAGVGMVNFAPSNSEEHSALPNALRLVYPRTVVSIPVGGGVNIPLSSALGLVLRAEHRFVFSPYLDDIKADHGNDALTTITLGFSYRFNAAPSHSSYRHAPPGPPPACHHCGCVIMMHGCCCHHGGYGGRPQERYEEPPPAPSPSTPSAPAPAPTEQPPAPSPDPPPAPTPEPEPTKTGKRKSFSKDIRFVVDTDQFDTTQPETAKNLEELLTYMQESCDELQVMIEGHASADGPPERNRELSRLRAQKVQQWLVSKGVTPSKIRGSTGYGSSMPRVAEPTPSAAKKMTKSQLESIRRQNRRIEVAVLRDCKVQ